MDDGRLPSGALPSPRPRPEIPRPGGLAAVGIVVVVLIAASLTAVAAVTYRATHASGLGGATSAARTESFAFSGPLDRGFPTCAWVYVEWWDPSGASIGFGIWQAAEVVLLTNCGTGAGSVSGAPSTTGCPPAVCPPDAISAGPGPVSYQEGHSGWVEFLAAQSNYTFLADLGPNSSTLTPDLVHLNLTYGFATPSTSSPSTIAGGDHLPAAPMRGDLAGRAARCPPRPVRSARRRTGSP